MHRWASGTEHNQVESKKTMQFARRHATQAATARPHCETILEQRSEVQYGLSDLPEGTQYVATTRDPKMAYSMEPRYRSICRQSPQEALHVIKAYMEQHVLGHSLLVLAGEMQQHEAISEIQLTCPLRCGTCLQPWQRHAQK